LFPSPAVRVINCVCDGKLKAEGGGGGMSRIFQKVGTPEKNFLGFKRKTF
jgi:hypothetical protein